MEPQNGAHEHRVLEERLGAFKEGVGKLVDRVIGKPEGQPSRFQAFAGKTTEAIKAHPIAAAAIAVGLGYLVVRIVRR